MHDSDQVTTTCSRWHIGQVTTIVKKTVVGWKYPDRVSVDLKTKARVVAPDYATQLFDAISNAFEYLHVKCCRNQCFLYSRIIGSVTPKIYDFHYLKQSFLDQSIRKIFYLISKKEAMVTTACRHRPLRHHLSLVLRRRVGWHAHTPTGSCDSAVWVRSRRQSSYAWQSNCSS